MLSRTRKAQSRSAPRSAQVAKMWHTDIDILLEMAKSRRSTSSVPIQGSSNRAARRANPSEIYIVVEYWFPEDLGMGGDGFQIVAALKTLEAANKFARTYEEHVKA